MPAFTTRGPLPVDIGLALESEDSSTRLPSAIRGHDPRALLVAGRRVRRPCHPLAEQHPQPTGSRFHPATVRPEGRQVSSARNAAPWHRARTCETSTPFGGLRPARDASVPRTVHLPRVVPLVSPAHCCAGFPERTGRWFCLLCLPEGRHRRRGRRSHRFPEGTRRGRAQLRPVVPKHRWSSRSDGPCGPRRAARSARYARDYRPSPVAHCPWSFLTGSRTVSPRSIPFVCEVSDISSLCKTAFRVLDLVELGGLLRRRVRGTDDALPRRRSSMLHGLIPPSRHPNRLPGQDPRKRGARFGRPPRLQLREKRPSPRCIPEGAQRVEWTRSGRAAVRSADRVGFRSWPSRRSAESCDLPEGRRPVRLNCEPAATARRGHPTSDESLAWIRGADPAEAGPRGASPGPPKRSGCRLKDGPADP